MNVRRTLDLRSNRLTHRLRRIPVLVLMPHSRCNCRCIMCDIWKANRNGTSISVDQLSGLLAGFRELEVEWVVLSGGEALMHPNLWALCSMLKALPAKISLLSTGLLLGRHALEIVRYCDDVIVSLDGSKEVHDRIRAVPNAFQKLADGVAALRAEKPGYPVSGRCVLQRSNFEDLPNIISTASEIGLDRISFLAADLTSDAFNRPVRWSPERTSEVCLTAEESRRFAEIVEETLVRHAASFAAGFVAEPPEKMRRLAAYYLAANGLGAFPETRCNAPWVSTVIEADGTLRPCFFHKPFGNVREQSVGQILNSAKAIAFRRGLDVPNNPICQRCVCTLNLE